jgi:DDE superfamily endonuclease
MNILNQVLSKLNLRKTQNAFLELLCTVILAIPSRINYANLERFSHRNEKTFRNWFEKPLDWILVTTSLIQTLQTSQRMGKRLILGVDCTNLRKAGKRTPGLAKFWDSKLGKAIPSLELSCCTLIDLEYRQAIPVQALQTPSVLPSDRTRVDHYTNHVQNVLELLPPDLRDQIECVVADAYYAKKTWVDGIVHAGQTCVGKLRIDANLNYKYTGAPTGKAGRPKQFDGKVDWQDFSRWNLEVCNDDQIMYSSVLYSKALKRDIRVVCILWQVNGRQRREVLFSTKLEHDALEVTECYRARFEMEFPFRDAKQFAGLMDCQSRSVQAMEFHWNASFLVTSLARAQQLLVFEGDLQDFAFSMEDAKRRAYNELFASRIIRLLPAEVSVDKFWEVVQDTLNLGVKAA